MQQVRALRKGAGRSQNPPRFTPRGGSTPPPGTNAPSFCLFRAQRGIPALSFINFKENQSASKATHRQPTKAPKKICPSSRQIQQQNASGPRKLRAILHRSFTRSGYEIESERDAQSVGDRGHSAHDKPGNLPAFRPVK